MARAAGIRIDWNDMAEISRVVPLLARVYPNGSGDVNQFHSAGGMAYVIGELLEAGLAHRDILTVWGDGFEAYAREPILDDEQSLSWGRIETSRDEAMLRPASDPFQPDGGMRLLTGNLGRACFKSSAVERDRWTIEAPARVFEDQAEVLKAFKAGDLDRDVVVVVRFQGPRANGMPELHALTPSLAVLQNRGHRVALVTDGRMSGASGKVPAAIHLTPEAKGGGPLARVRDGDMIKVCAETGELSVDADLATRDAAPDRDVEWGVGRELFRMMQAHADGAEQGASAMLASAGL
jgi:phosphogluconate dehydratase